MTRIESLASLVDKNTKLVDIGTDHAYLPIYLYKKNITKNIVASDISSNALNYAYTNLVKYNLENKIKLTLSNGFNNLNEEFDTAVISGMGTSTIKNILINRNIPNKLIISSHKNVHELRIFMQSLGYKIVKEISLKENNVFYDIIKYEKGIDTLSKYDILVGKSNNLEYREYLLEKYKRIYNKSKNNKYLEYINIIEKN